MQNCLLSNHHDPAVWNAQRKVYRSGTRENNAKN